MGWAHNVQSWHLHVRMPGVALLVVAVIVPVGGVLATATVLWVVEQSQLSPGGRLSRTRGPAPAFANAGPWWWLQVRRTKTCPTQDVCGASPDGAGDHTCNVESVATECHATTDQNGPQKYHYDSGPSRDAVPVAIWLHLIHETLRQRWVPLGVSSRCQPFAAVSSRRPGGAAHGCGGARRDHSQSPWCCGSFS